MKEITISANSSLNKLLILKIIVFGIIFIMVSGNAFSFAVREDGKVYIVDRKGERWNVTQAESIGFNPEGFQYGMGSDYFTPLDDSYLTDETDNVYSNLRILGVADANEAKAYSIAKLSRHEIANSKIGSEPIAVGY
jgi:hypothetical protein